MEKNHPTEPFIKEEEIVSLLEERLVVDRNKRKLGEVVVRKKVETRMVMVPVKREVLVIEKIGKEVEKLAEIDLGEGEDSGVEINHISDSESTYHACGEFVSPSVASKILDTIAQEPKHGCNKVRIELVVENSYQQESYQKIFDQITDNKST
ncbi:MAG: DUF2382 domain-containing protein [Cyanobacteria bacterium P01_A01_bin.84]